MEWAATQGVLALYKMSQTPVPWAAADADSPAATILEGAGILLLDFSNDCRVGENRARARVTQNAGLHDIQLPFHSRKR